MSSPDLSQKKRQIFLKVLAETGKVKEAAQALGYTDSGFLRRYYREDPEFAAEWDLAMNAAGDILETEAMRRAVEGIKEDIYYQGEIVGEKINYSDSLLTTLLKGAMPGKYRDNIKIDGEINHKVGIAVLPMTAPSLEDWEKAAVNVNQQQALGRIVEGKVVEEVKANKNVKLERE